MGIVSKGAYKIVSVKYKFDAFLQNDLCLRHNNFGNNRVVHGSHFRLIFVFIFGFIFKVNETKNETHSFAK